MPSKQQSLPAVLQQTLEHKELAPGVSAFKLTRAIVVEGEPPAWFASMLKTVNRHGLAKTSAVKSFARGASEDLVGNTSYLLASQEYLSLVQQAGFCAPHEDKDMLAQMQAVNADPLNPPEGWAVVRVDHSSNMLFDMQDHPMPIGLHFDYMSGNVRDGAYDLPRLVEHLKQNPQVRPLQGQTDIKVVPVPYYNVSAGCHSYVAFLFAPAQEQMQLMWDKAQTLNKKYPSTALHQAIFDLDLLGLRAAGIARGESFWDTKEDGPGAEEQDD